MISMDGDHSPALWWRNAPNKLPPRNVLHLLRGHKVGYLHTPKVGWKLTLEIQSPKLRMVMEPKYLPFRRWLYTPIIIWKGDWIPRVKKWWSGEPHVPNTPLVFIWTILLTLILYLCKHQAGTSWIERSQISTPLSPVTTAFNQYCLSNYSLS